MSEIIGEFKDDIKQQTISAVLWCNDNVYVRGVIVDSLPPKLSKSGQFYLWNFRLLDKTGAVKCFMFLLPEDEPLVRQLEGREVEAQGVLFYKAEGSHLTVHGIRYIE